MNYLRTGFHKNSEFLKQFNNYVSMSKENPVHLILKFIIVIIRQTYNIVIRRPVAGQRLGKPHSRDNEYSGNNRITSVAMQRAVNTTIEEEVFSMWFAYLHCWDSEIWSRVPRDSDPRMTALARANSNCKRQTCPLVRENVPHQQTRNCLTGIKT
jgi:hypothetical protein